MLSLSASQPTVSATGRVSLAILLHCAQHFAIDALDQVVAALIELVDAALGRGDLVVITCTCLVLLVPELDVGAGELGDQRADRFSGHAHHPRPRAPARRPEERRLCPSPSPR